MSEHIASRVLNLGTRLGRVISFTPRPLYPRWKSRRYLLNMRADGPQSRSGHGGEERKISSGLWNLICIWQELLLC